MSRERLLELLRLPREKTQAEQEEINRLYEALQGAEGEEETAGFFEAIKKTSQNLFSSASAGIEAIGEATGAETLDRLGERGQELVAPALSSGRRLKTFDDISDVGDAADWLFNSAFPQIATSIATVIPTTLAGAKIGAAGGSILGPAGTAVGGLVGGALGAFIPSMIMGTGEVAKEIKDRGGDAPGAAIGGGIAMGALDTVSMAIGLRGIAPKLFKTSQLFRSNVDRLVAEAVKRGAPPTKFKTALAHALQGAMAEGSIEVSQEVIADWVAQNATGVASPEGELSGRMFETFVLGGLGGATFGTIGGRSQAKLIQQNFDALKEVEGIEQVATEKATKDLADLRIDDMPQDVFTRFLLKNDLNNTRYIQLLSEGKLDEAKQLYKETYTAEKRADELSKYAQDALPEITLGRKTAEKEEQLREAYNNQEINDLYDNLKQEVLTKGRAQGLSDYDIDVPKNEVSIEEKIFQLARNSVMNEYIELADVGVADENRLLSSPALFEQFKREALGKDRRQLIAEHQELFPTGVGTDAATQEQNRQRMSTEDLAKQIALKRFKLANAFESLSYGKEETFDAPTNPVQLNNIWINEIGRSRERIVDPLSGKVTSFRVIYKRSPSDEKGTALEFKKKINTIATEEGEVPTNAEYILNDIDSHEYSESLMGKTFDEVLNELGGISSRRDLEFRLDPKITDDFYGGFLRLASYTGKLNENITYKPNLVDMLRKFVKYAFKPSGATKSEAFFELEKKKLGRLRAVNQRMLQLAHAYETAVVDAVIESNGEQTYNELNKIGADFLGNTQEQISVPQTYQRELIELVNKMKTDNLFTQEMKELTLKKIRSSKNIVGPKVNILDLPENMRAPLVAMRANIDSLTQRVLDEIPKSVLEQEMDVQEIVPSLTGDKPKLEDKTLTLKQIMERRLGSYLTDQYKAFDTGYNPFSFWEKWWGTKKTNLLKEKAVNAILKIDTLKANIEGRADKSGKTVQQEAEEFLQRMFHNEFTAPTLSDLYENKRDLLTSPVNFDKDGVEFKSPLGKLLETKGAQMIPEIRELFGIYDNPAQLAGITTNKLVNLVENYAFFNRLLELDATSGEKIFSPTKSSTFDTEVPLINTPITGFYTTKEMAEALQIGKRNRDSFTSSAYQYFLYAKGLAQAGKTVFSPMAQMRNFFTATMFYMANGHYFGNGREDWSNTLKTVMSELGARGTTQGGKLTFDGKQAQKVYTRLQELGVINTNTVTGELLNNLEVATVNGINLLNANEALYFLNQKLDEKAPQRFTETGVRGSTLFKGPIRLYQATDDIWKVMTFFAEKRKLENMWKQSELTELADYAKEFKGYKVGTNKYEDIIEHIASYNVRHTVPNYDYIGRAGNFLRKTPFGNFIAFPIEIMRTSLNMLHMGAREVKAGYKYNKPELRKRGYTRMMSYGMMAVGIPKAAAATAAMFAENDTEEEDGISSEQMAELRRLIPEYAKFNYIAPISLKDGKFRYFDLSHLAVYDMTAQLADAFASAAANGGTIPVDEVGRFTEQMMGLFEPFGEPSIFSQVLLDMLNNQKNTFRSSRGGDISKEEALGEYMKDQIEYFWEKAQPGIWAQTRDLALAMPDAEISFNKYGRKKDFEDALSAFGGVRIAETDIRTTLPFMINSYQKRARTARNIVAGIYQSGAVDAKQLKEEYIRANKALFNAQQELFLDFRAAMNAGVPKSFINKQNKDRTIFGTTKKTIKDNLTFALGLNQLPPEYTRFMRGQFVPFRMPESSIETFKKNTKEMARAGNLTGVRDIKWFEFDNYYNSLSVKKYSLLSDWDSQSEELASEFLEE